MIECPTDARGEAAAAAENSARLPSGPDLRSGSRIPAPAFSAIRRRMVLEFCKWDPQVGDVPTLADFPLVLSREAWDGLARQAERLAAEAAAAEAEILRRPELLRELGMPAALRRTLARAGDGRTTPSAARVIRFDFHPTPDGWRISEANSDVPGGYTESSAFAAMIAAASPGLVAAGDPAARLADALAAAGGPVVLLTAAGYMEDHQVAAYLASELGRRGVAARLAAPGALEWRDGQARINGVPVGAVVRFYQGEWFAGLPRRIGWEFLFSGGRTPVTNPGAGVITESKRFPLVWDRLSARLSTWREILPETRDPREAPWGSDGSWLIKSAFCNTGDTVCHPSWVGLRPWEAAARDVRRRPGEWVAQKRFDVFSLETPDGLRYPCIGVYTVNGVAAGAYGRISSGPVIDYRAVDAAVLVA